MKDSLLVLICGKYLWEKSLMAGPTRRPSEWIDGFLFVGNHLALDFLNTKPILDGAPRELLSDVAALERWLIASGVVSSRRDKAMVRAWRDSPRAAAFVPKLIAFRERLRAVVSRVENGSPPSNSFLAEVNRLLKAHPQRAHLTREGSGVALSVSHELRRPEDVWAPIVAAVTHLLSEIEPVRIRKCESEACVVHFHDTSKKGSRRWCSMNICGNRLKVAAYQRRRRLA